MVMLVALLALCGGTSLPANATAYRFEDFAVEVETIASPVPPRLDTAQARRMRTMLRGATKQPPNFAGHFRVVEWGCGTCCYEFAILNLRTGAAWFPSFFLSCGYTAASAVTGEAGTYYRPDSTLLVLRGARNEATSAATYYYRWDGSELRLLKEVRDLR